MYLPQEIELEDYLKSQIAYCAKKIRMENDENVVAIWEEYKEELEDQLKACECE